jgi:hypothetical protein
MLRLLPVLIVVVLLVVSLIDAVQTPEASMRNLPKWAWLLLIVMLPVAGPLAWMFAGRPRRTGRSVPWPATQTSGFPEYERPRGRRAPDDNPEFLATLKQGNAEHETMLKKWEEDLKRREEELRKDEDSDPTNSGPEKP